MTCVHLKQLYQSTCILLGAGQYQVRFPRKACFIFVDLPRGPAASQCIGKHFSRKLPFYIVRIIDKELLFSRIILEYNFDHFVLSGKGTTFAKQKNRRYYYAKICLFLRKKKD